MGAGTFAVHQLRYALSYGHTVGGHAYLVPVAGVLVALLLFAAAALLARVARRADEPAPRFGRLWAGTSVALVCVYTVQESLESVFSGQVPGGFAHGGWVTIPLAAAAGLLIALLMRGAAAATRIASGRAPWRAPAPGAPLAIVVSPWAPRPTRAAARHLAARGPPVVA